MADTKTTQPLNTNPPGFRNLIQRAMREQDLTLREVCRQADISPAYLSRLLNEGRGLPSDEIISRLEKVLKLEPRQLLYEAGRVDATAKVFLKKGGAPLLMRTLAPLSEKDLARVQKVADELARKYESKKP